VGRNCSGQAIVMGLSTIGSSWTFHSTKGIQGFDHAEYPATRLAVEVLNAMEGYLFRHIRGSGLAHGLYVDLDVEAGHLGFSLSGCSNPIKAFEEAASMMRGLVDGSIELTDTAVTAAMSTFIYKVASSVSTPNKAATLSFINQALKDVPRSHRLERFKEVKKEDIIAIFRQYFMPLFDSASSVVVVVTPSGKAQSICEELTRLGFDVTQKELLQQD